MSGTNTSPPSEGPLTDFLIKLVSVLSDFYQAGEQSMPDQVQVGSLGNVARRLNDDVTNHYAGLEKDEAKLDDNGTQNHSPGSQL
jgi:hypothetical protein